MKGSSFKKVAICLIISIMLFVGLLFIEKSILKPNGETDILIATDDIKEGTLLTDEILNSFKAKNVDSELSVTGAIKNKEELVNRIANENINKGEILSINSFISKDDVLKDIINPVEVSFNVSDMSQVVGGILREGDMIDISIVDSNTNENVPVLNKVYVEKAISSDGTEIGRNSETAALTLNVIIAKENEANLNTKINSGIIRVAKIK